MASEQKTVLLCNELIARFQRPKKVKLVIPTILSHSNNTHLCLCFQAVDGKQKNVRLETSLQDCNLSCLGSFSVKEITGERFFLELEKRINEYLKAQAKPVLTLDEESLAKLSTRCIEDENALSLLNVHPSIQSESLGIETRPVKLAILERDYIALKDLFSIDEITKIWRSL